MTSNENTWLVFGLLRDAFLPDPDQVMSRMRRADQLATLPSLRRAEGNLLIWQWEEAVASCALVPRPLPWSALEGPASTAWYWPQATASIRGHVAHLLLTFVDEGRDRVATCLRLTQLATAIAATSPTVAILWGPSGTVHEPSAFDEQATGTSRTQLPLYLWIDFRVQRVAEDLHQLFTTGLHRLGHMELEIPAQQSAPEDLVHRAYNVAHYVLDQQRDLNDGDTIGLPDGAHATIRHRPSFVDAKTNVMRIDFD